MTFSKEIMAVINGLAERLGIVIDWTAENVVPYITDLTSRYVSLTIWQNALWILYMLLGLISVLFILFKGIKMERESDEGIKYYDSDTYTTIELIGLIGTIFFTILNLIFIPGFINKILECIFIPEKVVLDYIKILIAAT